MNRGTENNNGRMEMRCLTELLCEKLKTRVIKSCCFSSLELPVAEIALQTIPESLDN